MIPAVIADSWFFWLAIIDGLAAVLPTVIGIARQVEGLGLIICLNTIPVGWPAALSAIGAVTRCAQARGAQRIGVVTGQRALACRAPLRFGHSRLPVRKPRRIGAPG